VARSKTAVVSARRTIGASVSRNCKYGSTPRSTTPLPGRRLSGDSILGMLTVRFKLVALVVACVAPAVAAAVLRSYESERELLAQVERRVDSVGRRFGAELDEYQDNAKLALSLIKHSTRFQQGLAKRDPGGTERLTKTLGDVYTDR